MSATGLHRPRASLRALIRDPWLLALGALLVGTFAVLTYLGRGTIFIYDDWDYWLMSQSYAPGELFQHYNGQASVVPKLVWFTTTHLFGGGEYWPFRVGAMLMHVATLAGLFFAMRPRLGSAVSFAVLIPLTLLGQTYLTLSMANTYHYFGLPVLWLVWAIVALDRGTRRGDVVACVLLVLSAFTSSSGLAPLAAVGAYLLWERPQWRRLWIAAIPAFLFLVWLVAERPEQRDEITRSDFANIPVFVVEGITTGLTRYTTLTDLGATMAIAAIALWVSAIVAGRRVDRGAVAFATAGVTLWALIAIGRGPVTRPWVVQYLFPDVVYAVVAVVLLAAGALALRAPRTAIVALVFGAAFFLPNAQGYVDQSRADRGQADRIRAGVSAVNLLAAEDPQAAMKVDPPLDVRKDVDYEPDTYVRRLSEGREPVGLTTPAQIEAEPEAFRAEVDRFLAMGIGARTGRADVGDATGPAPRPEATDGTVTTDGSCLVVTPQNQFASATLPASTPLIVAREGKQAVDVRMLRFASVPRPDKPPLVSVKGEPERFAPRPVRGQGWRVNLASAGPFRVCAA